MKSKKAFIKLNGEVGEKEQPAIEYNDNNYLKNQQKRVDDFNELLAKMGLTQINFKKPNKSIKPDK